ncbi:MAG TPA: GNAT family N-acetyltransferase [Caulobacterales bacterium]|nr:GNAT family N-acetyltransferase [Caulobacterales bacterium]
MSVSDNYVIAPVETRDDLRAIANLFADYAHSLPISLSYQDFAAECATLPGKYAPPAGALLLARGADGAPAGCVAMRPLDTARCCEMKRLYLAPHARGRHLGRALALAIVEEAKRCGYREMRLDTLSSMTAAIALYEQMGFERIAPYYAPTPDGTVFMALRLSAQLS